MRERIAARQRGVQSGSLFAIRGRRKSVDASAHVGATRSLRRSVSRGNIGKKRLCLVSEWQWEGVEAQGQ